MANEILIVDDSEDDITILKHVLKAARVTNPVFALRDGDECISYFKGEGIFADRTLYPLPSILFLDLKMPKVDGFDVLRWLRDHPPSTHPLIIVLSDFGDMHRVSHAYALGANTFLTKPVKASDLENLIKGFDSRWMRSAS